MIVDASALIDLLAGAPPADAIGERLFGRDEPLHAPVTIYAEVLHGLRRQWIARLLSDQRAALALKSLRTTIMTKHPIEPLVQRMWDLRRNVTAYDAAYVALAEQLDVPLITRDLRLSRSSGHAARIEYID